MGWRRPLDHQKGLCFCQHIGHGRGLQGGQREKVGARTENGGADRARTENGGADIPGPQGRLNIPLTAMNGYRAKGQSGEADKQGEETQPPV